MMDEQQNKGFGLYGTYRSGDPSINVPVTSSGAMVSPYLNFDPALITPSPESQFIFPEGASHRRGRFELAFAQIGGSVFAGAAAGGLNGFYTGLKETNAAQLTGAVKRTQMLNFITKQGASSAQTLGVIALMYSIFGVVISKARGADDELNTLAAATATGFLYKSSAGWKKCVRAGGIGFGLAAVYCLFTSKERIKQMAGMDN
jgi:import inner membrane translocase subunit TIM23